MKRFKIRETYTVTGWNYVEAENIEEAEKAFEDNDCIDDFNEVEANWEYETTDWKTLQEV